MKKTDEIIDGLNDLLRKSYEAANGFKRAADAMKINKVQRFLNYKAHQKRRFAEAIRDEIRLIGGTPYRSTQSSFSDNLNHFWIDLKERATDQDTQGILQSCENGERKVIKIYEEFLDNASVPRSLRSRLINQQNEISHTLVEIGHLEKVYEESYQSECS